MTPLSKKIPQWRQLLHKFQARRDIPFRKKFFVGYDLHGNTYWEFTPDGNMHRLRRKLEPFKESVFKSDIFETVPPQWLQWLRKTRKNAPTVQELLDDQIRQQQIKILAEHANQTWLQEKQRLEEENQLKLKMELDKVEKENQQFNEEARAHKEQNSEPQENPWAEADSKSKTGEESINSAFLKPRK